MEPLRQFIDRVERVGRRKAPINADVTRGFLVRFPFGLDPDPHCIGGRPFASRAWMANRAYPPGINKAPSNCRGHCSDAERMSPAGCKPAQPEVALALYPARIPTKTLPWFSGKAQHPFLIELGCAAFQTVAPVTRFSPGALWLRCSGHRRRFTPA